LWPHTVMRSASVLTIIMGRGTRRHPSHFSLIYLLPSRAGRPPDTTWRWRARSQVAMHWISGRHALHLPRYEPGLTGSAPFPEGSDWGRDPPYRRLMHIRVSLRMAQPISIDTPPRPPGPTLTHAPRILLLTRHLPTLTGIPPRPRHGLAQTHRLRHRARQHASHAPTRRRAR
jgi:hypothetical protein